jgi:3-ketosteroid 9alpha-monooxygenase subunit A
MTLKTTEAGEVSRIEAQAPSPRYARGWHCLGLTEKFKDGKPHALEIFGTKLVVFEGENGQVHILDGYCPHMGAELSEGRIIGDTLACPFHDWRWGGDGRCKDIPYASRVPVKARVKSWPVMEQSKQLFVYNDPEGNPPPPEVAIPPIPAVLNGETTEWDWETFLVPTNVRELIDNVSDMAHFYYVHFLRITHFKNIFENHTAAQLSRQTARTDINLGEDMKFAEADFNLDSEGIYYGPAYMIDTLKTANYKGYPVETYLINAHYPVTPNSFMLHCGVCAKRIPGLPEKESLDLSMQYAKAARDSFFQDVRIWQHKTRIDNPLLCEGDGPVYQLRRWYEQFYRDIDKVEPDMVKRFEYEMDLTTHNLTWDGKGKG